tara:strand:+ start:149 stop:1084 length:936 start_codon:yes stop_codon:yes gene_type:complete
MRAIRFHLTAGLLAFAAVAAAGCSPEPAPPVAIDAPAIPSPTGAATTYACASGREITVSYPDATSIRLAYLGQDYAMVQVGVASGARYVGADMAWSTTVSDGLDHAVLSRAGADGSPGGVVLEQCARPVSGPDPVQPPVLPVPTPTRDAPSPPPCKGPQLQLEEAGGDGGMGNRVAVVAVRNLATAACSLSGYPVISLVDDRNRALDTVRAETGPGSYFRSGQTPTPVILPPGGRAWFDLAWNVVPHEAEGETVCPTAARIRMTAPGDTSPVWLAHALTPCGGQIRVSPFRPVVDPVPAETAPSAPGPAQP